MRWTDRQVGHGARSSARHGVRRKQWRGRGRILALVGLMLALPSCLWPAPGAGPDRTAHNAFEKRITPDSVADLEEIWSAPTGSGVARSPVTSDDAVHVAAGHRLYSFDKGTGSELWVREDPDLPDFAIICPATFADDLLWLGYGIGNLGGNWVTERVDPATGDVVDVPGPTGTVDGVRGDSYLISTVGFGSGGPVALSITIGDTQDPSAGWSAFIDVRDFGAPWSPLTLGREHAYQAGPGILDPEAQTQGNGVRGYSTASKPDCPPDLPDSLACPTWTTELDGSWATSPVLGAGGSTLYTATDAGTVYAVDTSNGVIEWTTPAGAEVKTEPALANGSLYVPTADGRLVVLDAETGYVLWEADAGDELREQPAVAGGLVFTGARDGSVQAFDAAGCGTATCDSLWSASAGAAVTGAPAVSQGQLYVGTSGGLSAYGLPTDD